ncbi:iron chelate uptake ABC transporter family permease subunit [Isoptericola sp. b441]|uniref:Iron chelate uptake ABC transporter family permease subunit n=1 Tax=Actinotalea lenta TaxID=3064654 RepID=A0ABT9D8T0_9CELL|nr:MULTISPECIES: putative F420-0 ABC transporter permease subunit [unclassified Isoptericola]MDO8107296.1 iron chelate uptake ABC transporter family permease subunit [Isoptericola sp. b441]MDO8121042.1 iron chelate uptake ABC transporter family permease subunit [Isoptericola sp. b490]
MRRGLPAWAAFTLAALVLLASLVVAVTIGPAGIAPADVWATIAHHVGLPAPGTLSPLLDGIVWELRLPRVITAALVGAGLAVAGAVMQTLVRNPLADPYLLGLSGGASLGAVAVLVLGISVLLPVAAFVGALAALVAALTLAGRTSTLTPSRTVLAGLAVGQLAAAGTSFVIFWSATGDSYRSILAWLMGSLAGAEWSSVAIAGVAVGVVATGLALASRPLDAFALGDTAASALGIPVSRARWAMLVAVALLTGALVAVSGAIGFVGLTVPHAVRLVVGGGHRRLLALSTVVGATFLVWADTAARAMFAPRELPVGIVTAFVGAPVFALLLWRRRGREA